MCDGDTRRSPGRRSSPGPGLPRLYLVITRLRVSQDSVAVTTPPNPDDLDPSQCQGLPAAARPHRSAGGPDLGTGDSPIALAEERGLWTPSRQPWNALPRREAVSSAHSSLAGLSPALLNEGTRKCPED